MSTLPKPPEILDKIVDLVLAHRPDKEKRKKGKASLPTSDPARTTDAKGKRPKPLRKSQKSMT